MYFSGEYAIIIYIFGIISGFAIAYMVSRFLKKGDK